MNAVGNEMRNFLNCFLGENQMLLGNLFIFKLGEILVILAQVPSRRYYFLMP